MQADEPPQQAPTNVTYSNALGNWSCTSNDNGQQFLQTFSDRGELINVCLPS